MTTSPLQYVLCEGTARQARLSTTLLRYYGLLAKNIEGFFYGNSRHTVYYATTVYLYLRFTSVYMVRLVILYTTLLRYYGLPVKNSDFFLYCKTCHTVYNATSLLRCYGVLVLKMYFGLYSKN